MNDCIECGDRASQVLACGFAVCGLCWDSYGVECSSCDGYHAQCNFAQDSPTRRQHVARVAEPEGRPPDEDQIVLACTFWVPGPGLCGWTGKASQAVWCTHYREWVCPRCGSTDGLRIVEGETEPAPDAHLEEAYELRFETEVA